MRYQCTECDVTHETFNAAAKCHWGIGGVIEVDETPTSNHWYVSGHQYDSLVYACEDAMYEHTVVLDDNDKVVADYRTTPPMTQRQP